jgi:glycosyltransferase involved in cell wall biosynthesis
VPKAYGDENQEAVRLVNASDIDVNMKESIYKEYWKRIEYMEIGSNIIPYVSPEEFTRIHSQKDLDKISKFSHVFDNNYEFKGGYGTNLLQEVSRYALIASALAMSKDFDIIHAHDWLTYPAGIAAKYVSGKPLVIHVHATEFDRSGENVNPQVYEIEKKGMEEADKIITVSNFTRSIVIEKYGIPEDKVVTVHNAVEPTERKDVDGHKYVPEKIVTFLGRITFQKGPDYFIEAARMVLERDENVRFVMAGSGDLMEKMIRRVAQLRIGHKFHFNGCNAVGFRTFWHCAPGSHAFQCAGRNLQAVRGFGSPETCPESRFLGCERYGGCHLRADSLCRASEDVYEIRSGRGGKYKMGAFRT